MSDGPAVDVTDLTPAQLNDVRQQLDEELKVLTTSYGRLVEAQGKFRSCIASCEYLALQAKAEQTDGKAPISLVPLTSSLYVPGRITAPSRVVVDIGTGYYVEKEVPSAIKLYQDKISFLNDRIRSLQETIQKKQDNLRVATDILRVVCYIFRALVGTPVHTLTLLPQCRRSSRRSSKPRPKRVRFGRLLLNVHDILRVCFFVSWHEKRQKSAACSLGVLIHHDPDKRLPNWVRPVCGPGLSTFVYASECKLERVEVRIHLSV